jgi:circadian clock protein KaiB
MPDRKRLIEMADEHVFKLYVLGHTSRSEGAVRTLRKLFGEELKIRYRLKVIDVLEQPRLAEEDRVLATPTLIKETPPPSRRIIGDLSDREKVLDGLQISVPAGSSSGQEAQG